MYRPIPGDKINVRALDPRVSLIPISYPIVRSRRTARFHAAVQSRSRAPFLVETMFDALPTRFGQPRQDDLLDHLCTLNQTSIDSIGLPSSRFGSNPRSLRKPVR